MSQQYICRPAHAGHPPRLLDAVFRRADGEAIGIYEGKPVTAYHEEGSPDACLVTQKEFEKLEADFYVTEPEEIQEDEYILWLESLPPLDWQTHSGLESFKMSELITGQITRILVWHRPSNRYFKFIDVVDLDRDAIRRKMQVALKDA